FLTKSQPDQEIEWHEPRHPTGRHEEQLLEKRKANASNLHFIVAQGNGHANHFAVCQVGEAHLFESANFCLLELVHILETCGPSQCTIQPFYHRLNERRSRVPVRSNNQKNHAQNHKKHEQTNAKPNATHLVPLLSSSLFPLFQ